MTPAYFKESTLTGSSPAGSHWTQSRQFSSLAAGQHREVVTADSAASQIPEGGKKIHIRTLKSEKKTKKMEKDFLNWWGWILTLGWARMEASSCVHWLVSNLYCPLLEGRVRVAITDIIFCRPVAVIDTVMEGAEAEARARPTGHPRTVTGSWMWESCTEPRSLITGFNPGISSSARSFASSSSASARDFSTV